MSWRAASSAAETACASTCSSSTPKRAIISGPSGSTSRLADLFDMQDEIVARLAGALNAQLAAAEARRAEQTPTPDSMDLYFQGLAWFNKGMTPDNLAQARSFFDRALSADPDNVDALIGSARADVTRGRTALCDRSHGGLRCGRSEVDQSLVVGPGPRARPYVRWDLSTYCTKRAAQGIAECEHALALDRNLATAHAAIGLGKIFIGRAEETEAHIAEALRLSPRDTLAYTWMTIRGRGEESSRQLASKRSRGFDGRSRPTEIIR